MVSACSSAFTAGARALMKLSGGLSRSRADSATMVPNLMGARRSQMPSGAVTCRRFGQIVNRADPPRLIPQDGSLRRCRSRLRQRYSRTRLRLSASLNEACLFGPAEPALRGNRKACRSPRLGSVALSLPARLFGPVSRVGGLDFIFNHGITASKRGLCRVQCDVVGNRPAATFYSTLLNSVACLPSASPPDPVSTLSQRLINLASSGVVMRHASF